ncbi:MAG: peptide chain release factor N(5)-glutamine methyltransferase [Bacteroidia bacterium]
MKIASNKITDILRFFRSELAVLYESGEIESFIAYCFEAYLGMQKASIVLNKDKTVTESELLKFNFAVKKLKQYEPIQYILGKADFYGLKLGVNAHVLIPRPETEELVDIIIKENTSNAENRITILDIGTGSGCIAIALKKHIPFSDIYAVDVSKEALEVAKKNAQLNSVDITFQELNILSIPEKNSINSTKFDIIVSNPPYITDSEKEKMDKNVTEYEPHLALFVKDYEPLLFYKHICDLALSVLKKGGKIYFEINQQYGTQTKSLLEQKGFKNVELIKDLNNNYRIVKGTLD